MGKCDANPAAIAASRDGKGIDRGMEVMSMPEDSQASGEYWANCEKGLRKMVHGEGLSKWSSFVPLATGQEPERNYP